MLLVHTLNAGKMFVSKPNMCVQSSNKDLGHILDILSTVLSFGGALVEKCL